MSLHNCPIEPGDESDGRGEPIECRHCCGSGWEDEDSDRVCPHCHGAGEKEYDPDDDRFDDNVM